ncbi:MAG: tetrapyrrole methylase family protein [Bacteroidota bacterium]|jgi:16S rRNA (cytidine1402-2'-O)-methyltransferase|nr:tetrapyrrole methylase family protein [Bacteroidota bacterium]
MKLYGTLYLLPVGLGDCNIEDVLPKRNLDLIKTLIHYIAENAKDARAFLKQCGIPEISKAEISLINQHAKEEELNSFLKPLLEGHDMGLMSDAGCPGIADPGADIIKRAHQKGIKVVPLVGPSSIVLSIMASGFNGQNFAFTGYLPINSIERCKRIKELEQLCQKQKQAQFFIETPYRNGSVFEDLLKTLQPGTQLLVATHITLTDENISVKPVAAWKKNNVPDFFKKPTVFGIYA